jgi:phage shock protein PspC (stress-responsive transcriptional regulator)
MIEFTPTQAIAALAVVLLCCIEVLLVYIFWWAVTDHETTPDEGEREGKTE